MNEFEQMVRAAIEDELQDASFYTALAAQAPSAELRSIISSIAGDEIGHARTFSTMLGMEMMAAEAYPGPSGKPGQFMKDVRAAIDGELEAVCEYAEMAQAAPNDKLRAVVMGIMGDESGHARTFLTILATCAGSGGGLG